MSATKRRVKLLLLVVLLCLCGGGAAMIVRGQQPPQPAQSPQKQLTGEQLAALGEMLKETNKLFNQAIKLETAEKYDEAIPLVERILVLYEQTYGPDNEFVATPLVQIARLYQKKDDYRRAEPYARRALAIAEKTLKPDDVNLTLFLSQAAAIANDLGDYERAATLYERKLAINEQAKEADNYDLALNLVSLANVYRRQADYVRAEPALKRALALMEKAVGPDDPKLIGPLDNLATLYVAKADLDRAAPLQRRALALREKAYGPEHFLYAIGLINGATIYRERGEYVRAEQNLQRALPIFEKDLGADNPKLSTLLSNLAELYETMGDFERAEALEQRALAIDEKVYGLEHVEVAQDRHNLANLYLQRRDLERAEPLYQSALATREKLLGPAHPDVAMTLSGLALLYDLKHDYTRAAPLLQRALAIREKALGPQHPDVALALNNLAALYQDQQDFERAGPLYQRALAIRERALGPRHPDTASVLTNMAILSEAKGAPARALPLITRADDIREETLALVLTTGSERRKQLYSATVAPETNYTVSLHLHALPGDMTAARLALTTVLRRKGRALDAMTDQISALRRRLNPADQQLLDQLSTARAQLSTLLLHGVGTDGPVAHEAARSKLQSEIERLETQVSTRSAEFRAQAQTVTLAAVQQAVPADAALVEFVLYRPVDARAQKLAPGRYAAYVLQRKGAPRWVELGEAATVEQAISAWRAALADPRRKDVQPLARTVDERIMRPVREMLGDTRTLFVSPDGALNLIPFGALVDEQNRYLVESYTLTYLTSGRDLLRLGVRVASRQSATLFADPVFDADANVATAQAEPALSVRRSAEMTNAHFNRLPGTAQEADAISALLSAPQVFTKEQATEAALKGVTGPRILHVATHGFFLKNQPASTQIEARGLALGNGSSSSAPKPTAPPGENLLLRSGLAFAGANGRAGGTGEDGILTALEAAGLDLWGTQLVVLSACETGLGEVKTGDGVYGLRRALVLAGAESQVISLWQVSDTATRDLMVGYYTRLQAGEGRTEALRHVQLAMIKSKPQRAGTRGQRGLGGEQNQSVQSEERSHPFYWASFIQSGAWQRMDGTPAKAK